jgi:hypothetical protein
VRIALVTDVPHYLVARGIEHGVDRDGELDDTEACADMAAGSRTHLDEALAHRGRELAKLVAAH